MNEVNNLNAPAIRVTEMHSLGNNGIALKKSVERALRYQTVVHKVFDGRWSAAA